MTKPSFAVDISPSALSPLEAHLPLTLLTDERCRHHEIGLRAPLGIYNISISRICDKVVRLCQRMENYFIVSDTLQPLQHNDDLMQELVDYIELALYAAAEHVDDVESIATGFFKDTKVRDKIRAYRTLQTQLKQHKKLLSAAANAIKHQQSRIRIFSMEFRHEATAGCLHGYFIEGVDAGVVCPSPIFHKKQDVFSITTLAWEILVFLLNCSRDLALFIQSEGKQFVGPAYVKCEIFQKAVIAAARLPLYAFGEEHPFSRVTLSIFSSDGNTGTLDSTLYGSLKRPWTKSSNAEFGSFTSRFVGDGKTKSFRYAQPKSVALHHWQ
jgi:hypothetical protein